jgi:hypothetical protein
MGSVFNRKREELTKLRRELMDWNLLLVPSVAKWVVFASSDMLEADTNDRACSTAVVPTYRGRRAATPPEHAAAAATRLSPPVLVQYSLIAGLSSTFIHV